MIWVKAMIGEGFQREPQQTDQNAGKVWSKICDFDNFNRIIQIFMHLVTRKSREKCTVCYLNSLIKSIDVSLKNVPWTSIFVYFFLMFGIKGPVFLAKTSVQSTLFQSYCFAIHTLGSAVQSSLRSRLWASPIFLDSLFHRELRAI